MRPLFDRGVFLALLILAACGGEDPVVQEVEESKALETEVPASADDSVLAASSHPPHSDSAGRSTLPDSFRVSGRDSAVSPRLNRGRIRLSASGEYLLQVGAFGSRAQAERLAQRVRKAGYPVYVVPQGDNHRVRIGFFLTREEALEAGQSLKRDIGVETWVLMR